EIKSTSRFSPPHKVVKLSAHFCQRMRIWCARLGGSEGVMPDRAISLASALLVQSVLAAMFAAAMLTGVSTAASAAGDCLDNPDLLPGVPGHWFSVSARTQTRQCWPFDPATPAPAPPAPPADTPPLSLAAPAPATTGDTPQALLSRFAAGLSETFSP